MTQANEPRHDWSTDGEGMVVAEIDLQAELARARFVSMNGSDLLQDRVPSAYWHLTEFDEYSRFAAGLKTYDK